VYATLRAALNRAVRDGLIPVNPALAAKHGGARRPRAVVWTEDWIKQWREDGIRPAVAVWTAPQSTAFRVDHPAGGRAWPRQRRRRDPFFSPLDAKVLNEAVPSSGSGSSGESEPVCAV
jgi:hypothetical protein